MTVEQETKVMVVEPADPQVVYVPTCSPTVVYGTWLYPAPASFLYYPPGYAAGAALFFGVGLAVGAAWGYAWGGCGWGHNEVNVDIDRNTNINNSIDRDKYKNEMKNKGQVTLRAKESISMTRATGRGFPTGIRQQPRSTTGGGLPIC